MRFSVANPVRQVAAALAAAIVLTTVWFVVALAFQQAPVAEAGGDPTSSINLTKRVDGPDTDTVFTFTLTDENGPVAADVPVMAGGGGGFGGLAPGSYTLTESIPSGDYATEFACHDGFFDGAFAQAFGNSITLEVTAGADWFCTVENTDLSVGDLEIEKRIQNDQGESNDGLDFEFTLVGPEFDADDIFFLGDGNEREYDDILVGTYTITETHVPGFRTNIECRVWDRETEQFVVLAGVDSEPGNTDDVSLDVPVGGGQDVMCEVVNVNLRGSITVIKNLEPNDDTDFDFELIGPTGPNSETDTFDAGYREISGLAPGEYRLVETLPDGSSFETQFVCNGDSVRVSETQEITLDLAPGENIVCTVTNTDQARADIEVNKRVRPSPIDDNDSFVIGVRSASAAIVFDEFDEVGHNGDREYEVTPGDYIIYENDPGAEFTTRIECYNRGLLVAEADGIELPLTLAPGDDVRCDVINTRMLGSLEVCKDHETDGSNGDFAVIAVLDQFEFEVTGQAPFTLTDNDCSEQFQVEPGNYTVTEMLPPGRDIRTSIFCSDDTVQQLIPTAAAQADGPEVTVPVAAGESITCWVFNDESTTASLSVFKVSEPAPQDRGFDFTLTGLGELDGFEETFHVYPFDGDERFEGLPAGSYDLTEVLGDDDSATITSIECGVVDRQPRRRGQIAPFLSSETFQGPSVVVDLSPGDRVQCVFTNVDTSNAIVAVQKDVRSDRRDPTNFTFNVTGPDYAETFVLDDDSFSTVTKHARFLDNLPPGSYNITETPVPGYTTTIECYAGLVPFQENEFNDGDKEPIFLGGPSAPPETLVTTVGSGSVDFVLGGGESVSCQFTNTRDETPDATLIVVKEDRGDTGRPIQVTVREGGLLIAQDTIADDGVAPKTLNVGIFAQNFVTVEETVTPGFIFNREQSTCVNQDGEDMTLLGRGRAIGPVRVMVEINPFAAPANQIAFGDVLPGDVVTCTLVNDIDPEAVGTIEFNVSSGEDGTDFEYITTSPSLPGTANLLPVYVLDDDDDPTLPNGLSLQGELFGKHTITQTSNAAYTSNLTCDDPTGDTTISGLTATIELDPGETVTCTYTNTLIPDEAPVAPILAGPITEGEAPAAPPAPAVIPVAVVDNRPPLAATGADADWFFQISMALIGTGMATAAASRHRRRTT